MIKIQAFSQRYSPVLSILVALFLQVAVNTAAYGTDSTDDGMEVLTRGPIHEAFAEVSVDEPEPEMVVRRDVPEPVNEIPPDYRPEGDNVQWIPGYWSWDDDLDDFIWISGVWRDIPPGRQWVPGYWLAVSGGSRFVSGYWAESNHNEALYLPPPPEPLHAAPGSPAFSADNIWIDGHWLWSGNRYLWQSGYWLRPRPEMVWIPAHYIWTPRGYIFVPGYWDYQLVRRGVIFAPRHYSRPIYRTRTYYYTPRIVLDTDAIFLSLFIRRGHHHYYFGDYHDVRYERRGFVPWYSRNATRHGHDPYYKSYRWYRSRHDHDWEHKYRQQYEYRRDHREARPPVFYRARADHGRPGSHDQDKQMIGRHLPEFIEKTDHGMRFTRTPPDTRQDYEKYDGRANHSKTERKAVEMEPKNRSTPQTRNAPEQAHFPQRQQVEAWDKQRAKSYQQPRDQPQDGQRGNQRQKQQWQPVNNQPHVDQHRQEYKQKWDGQRDTPRQVNPSRNSYQESRHRTDKEPGRHPERPAVTSEGGQKKQKHQVKQQNSPVTESDQGHERKQVKQTGRQPIYPGEQADEQQEAIQGEGQIIRKKTW